MTSTPERELPVLAGTGGVCPHLRAASGQWRSAVPTRDHVCTADGTPVPVGLEAQRRLCLGTAQDCERFRAAADARRAFAPNLPSRPIARTAPVVLERGRAAIAVPHVAERRTLGQAALAAVMVLAVIALFVARIGNQGGGAGSVATPTPGPSAPGSSVPSPSPTPIPTPSPTPVASATPSPEPTRTPKPTSTPATRTYRVQSGDTLSAIAAKFGTTVNVLKTLNGISDPSLIHVGQILKLP